MRPSAAIHTEADVEKTATCFCSLSGRTNRDTIQRSGSCLRGMLIGRVVSRNRQSQWGKRQVISLLSLQLGEVGCRATRVRVCYSALGGGYFGAEVKVWFSRSSWLMMTSQVNASPMEYYSTWYKSQTAKRFHISRVSSRRY